MVSSGPRGCGDSRQQGGAYLCTDMGEEGIPLWTFLVDPPIQTESISVPSRGMIPVINRGIVHAMDKIGSQYYINLQDFLQEGIRMGFSRRIPSTFDFSLLTVDSCLLFVHDRASISNPTNLEEYRCPTFKDHSHKRGDICLGATWHDIEEGVPEPTPQEPFRVRRTMPGFSYLGNRPPKEGISQRKQALFLKLPIQRIEVVKGNNHEETTKKASLAHIPVLEVDE